MSNLDALIVAIRGERWLIAAQLLDVGRSQGKFGNYALKKGWHERANTQNVISTELCPGKNERHHWYLVKPVPSCEHQSPTTRQRNAIKTPKHEEKNQTTVWSIILNNSINKKQKKAKLPRYAC